MRLDVIIPSGLTFLEWSMGQKVPVSLMDQTVEVPILAAKHVEGGVQMTFEVPDAWAPTLLSEGWNLSTETSSETLL